MYSGYVIVCFLEEVMAAPEQKRHESQEEYRFRISSAAEKARILHRQRVATGEVPPPEGRGPGTHPGYERDFPPPLPPEPEDPSLQGTDPVLDALLWGSALGPLAKTGVQALPRMLRNRRVIRGPSGKPETFYHGTRKQFGELDPSKGGPVWLTTAPREASQYAEVWSALKNQRVTPPGARVYRHSLAPKRPYRGGKAADVDYHRTNPDAISLGDLKKLGHDVVIKSGDDPIAVVLDKKAFLPPGGLSAPKKLPPPRIVPLAGTSWPRTKKRKRRRK